MATEADKHLIADHPCKYWLVPFSAYPEVDATLYVCMSCNRPATSIGLGMSKACMTLTSYESNIQNVKVFCGEECFNMWVMGL